MSNVRTATWNLIGTDISSAKNINEALDLSGLNFDVQKRKIYTSTPEKSRILIPGSVATVNMTTGQTLGIVSPKYEVCTNQEAFDFVNYIDDEIKFVTAGTTSAGMVYVVGALPTVSVLGDEFTPFLIFQNSFNGGFPVKTTICPLRLVCQNQFAMAFRESQNTVKIRHGKSLQTKLDDAKELLRNSATYMKDLQKTFEEYSKIKISDSQVVEVIEALFPIKPDMKDSKKEKIEYQRAALLNAYNCDDNQNFRKTLLGLVNAESDYITHRENVSSRQKNYEENMFSWTINPGWLTYFIDTTKKVLKV